jgi:SNF2 family DNA or RNA helicase
MATKSKFAIPFKKPSITLSQRLAAARLSQRPAEPETWKPHRYQLKALKFLLERLSAGLFLDPGLGKTSIVYAAVRVLKNKGERAGTLVVAPRRPAVMVWRQERDRWREFQDISVGLVHGPKRDEVWAQNLDVYVTTYDGFLQLIRSGELKKALRSGKVRNLVFDELSKMKVTKTVRFKTIKPWLAKFDRRWGLTGSPAANGLMDLFGECFAMDLGRSLGKFITHYRFQYFDAYGDETHPQYTPKPGAEEAIYARLANLVIRIDAEDHLKLPKLVPNKIYVDLPDKARAAYDEMEAEFMVELADQVFTADGAAALSQKCRQMASGALYEDIVDPLTGMPRTGRRKYAVLHDEKLDALEDLIDELNGQPLFVMYEYGHDLERLLKRLGKDTPFIGGGTSDKKALEYQEAWNLGWIPTLLGHPASVGHGLNFQRGHANQIATFSLTWNYEYYDQFIRRLRRQGNEAARVFVHHILARDTVDDLIMTALGRKGALQTRLHDALKNYSARRKYTGLLA